MHGRFKVVQDLAGQTHGPNHLEQSEGSKLLLLCLCSFFVALMYNLIALPLTIQKAKNHVRRQLYLCVDSSNLWNDLWPVLPDQTSGHIEVLSPKLF